MAGNTSGDYVEVTWSTKQDYGKSGCVIQNSPHLRHIQTTMNI